mmetsp:Transcript_27697/g.31990  ORF Transcript_27697/g.31990 Transcript_27697/m.31990 type:complete len:100 (+) Transcript_27697:198-497(+)
MARGKIIHGGFKITLEQLKIAAKTKRKREPVCHQETMKVLMALKGSNFETAPIWPLIKQADDCFAQHKKEKTSNRHKPSTLYHLSKYLVGRKNRPVSGS